MLQLFFFFFFFQAEDGIRYFHVTGVQTCALPISAGVDITWLTAAQSFDIMLDRGEIDAAYGFAPRHDPKLFKLNIDRYGGTPLDGNPRLRKLFADGGRAVVDAFFNKTGLVPANHVIVAQRRLLDDNPWLAGELYKIFSESKQAAYERSNFAGPAYLYFE